MACKNGKRKFKPANSLRESKLGIPKSFSEANRFADNYITSIAMSDPLKTGLAQLSLRQSDKILFCRFSENTDSCDKCRLREGSGGWYRFFLSFYCSITETVF